MPSGQTPTSASPSGSPTAPTPSTCWVTRRRAAIGRDLPGPRAGPPRPRRPGPVPGGDGIRRSGRPPSTVTVRPFRFGARSGGRAASRPVRCRQARARPIWNGCRRGRGRGGGPAPPTVTAPAVAGAAPWPPQHRRPAAGGIRRRCSGGPGRRTGSAAHRPVHVVADGGQPRAARACRGPASPPPWRRWSSDWSPATPPIRSTSTSSTPPVTWAGSPGWRRWEPGRYLARSTGWPAWSGCCWPRSTSGAPPSMVAGTPTR